MNEGQKKFLSFILERTKEEQKENAENLLNESFSKQADGTFNLEYMHSFIPRMLSCIREDAKDEVLQIMTNFKH